MRLGWSARPFAVAGLALLIGGSWISSARADFFQFTTPTGSTVGAGPVSAEADFTTSADTVTIVLKDLQADPSSVGQLLSDLSFTVASGQTAGTLTSGTGQERTVISGGTFTDGDFEPAGWVLSSSGSTFTLDVLSGTGHAGPAHLIIGPPGSGNAYNAADASIAGNATNNPFLANQVTFVLNIPGVTSTSGINNVVFSFGTTPGVNVPAIPEPASWATMAIGLVSLGVVRRWRRRAA